MCRPAWMRPLGPSQRIEAPLEQAELVAFWIGEDMPGFLACLTDVGRTCPELQEAFKLSFLLAVGRIDVNVQPRVPRLQLIVAKKDDGRLGTAEAFAGPDLYEVLFTIEQDEVQNVAPEPR
jgi:hypothetical protein